MADELTPAQDPDLVGFDQVIQDSIRKGEGSNAFGKVISAEAKKLNQDLRNKGLKGSAGRGKKKKHFKGKNKALKIKKDKIKKVKNKKNK